VVDSDRKLLGVVRDAAVAEATRKGVESLTNLMDPDDVVAVSPDTVVAELLTPSAECPVPLAVVDEGKRLVGVIPRVTLLLALGGGAGEADGNGTTEDASGTTQDVAETSTATTEEVPS
jgi:glycine betaine/proline transport system ATP-binding protein